MSKSIHFEDIISSDIIIGEIDAAFRFTTASEQWKYKQPPKHYNMLIFVMQGTALTDIDGESFTVSSGNLIYIPSGATFSSRGLKGIFDYYCLHFNFENFPACYPFKKFYEVPSPDYYERLFENISFLWLSRNIGYMLQIRALIYQILGNLLTDSTMDESRIKGLETIKKSIEYMEDNYFSPSLTVENIASASGITSAHFRNLFKSIYAVSPLKHINNIRISHAARYLQYTPMPVNKISEALGFTNVYHFSKVFKAAMGVSPAAYRKKLNND